MRERLVARNPTVAAPEDAGRGAARGRERLEAERGEDARRAGIPGIRDDERARRLVECPEAGGLLALRRGHFQRSSCRAIAACAKKPATKARVRTQGMAKV